MNDGVGGFSRYTIVGGAGFIGSHYVDRLLATPSVESVTVVDNFSSGREWHLAQHKSDQRLSIVRADVRDEASLRRAITGAEVVVHLASNPDIARAVTEPAVDFDQGTLLSHCVLEAARRCNVSTVIYASGSGVYGDLGETVVSEDHGPMEPISTYGASKLAGESLLCAYVHMFGLRGYAFRFGNVVGARQTHGVGFDFIRRLLDDPSRLRILGDGSQRKPYVFVEDVIQATLTPLAAEVAPFRVYNVATEDLISVRDIADLALETVGLAPGSVRYEFTGGDRGWKGDVPVVRLDSRRIRSLGWQPTKTSRQAMGCALQSMLIEVKGSRQ